ncbi:hypothetical protein JOB18_025286 [Solea senegalensis]|uniref:Secreted protein n=1 Tax=Solea senegalensis TaxID=28829 RepID=A0AAV6QGQ7_SOLSE|nr:hypothetical protein JOB18_025286 [Solea senegalensis]
MNCDTFRAVLCCPVCVVLRVVRSGASFFRASRGSSASSSSSSIEGASVLKPLPPLLFFSPTLAALLPRFFCRDVVVDVDYVAEGSVRWSRCARTRPRRFSSRVTEDREPSRDGQITA